MDTHLAKCTVLRKCCDDLTLAINADLDNLSSKLRIKGLIPTEVFNRGVVAEIVSTVESRLVYDESAWEKLIKALCASPKGWFLAQKLKKQVNVELSGEDGPGGNIPGEQQQNRGESPCCITILCIAIGYCCVACVG